MLTSSATLTGGTFTLTFNGQTTVALAFNAAIGVVQSALESLSTIGVGNVTVTSPATSFYQITFQGALGGVDQPSLTGDGTALIPAGGTLTIAELTKGGTANPLGTGNVTVGDQGGGAGADVLRYGSLATANEISNLVTVTVASSGLLNLNGKSDAIGGLVLNSGRNASASVVTGAGSLQFGDGLYSGITVNPFGATDGTSPAASIAGTLDLGGVPRSIVANDSFVPSAAEDLVISANVIGASAAFVPGLRETRLTTSAFDETTPATGTLTQLGVRMGQTSAKGPWGDNETWVYTGQFFDADGVFSFAEAIDDNVLVKIDGVTRLRSTNWNIPTTTGSAIGDNRFGGVQNFGMGPNGDGWHNIELRFGNGTGGAGPVAGSGWTASYGFGLATSGSQSDQGTAYVVPVDSGTGNLFRSSVSGELQLNGAGTVALTANNTFAYATTINQGTLVLRNGGRLAGATSVNVNGGGVLRLDNTASSADRVNNAAAVTVSGGAVTLVGNSGGTTEQIGALTFNPIINPASTISTQLNQGTDSIVTIDSSAGGVAELQATSLVRNVGASAHFVGVGADLGSTTNSRLQITGGTSPFTNNVLPWATMSGPSGYDLVTDADGTAGSAPYYLGRVTAYSSDINSGGIVRLSGATSTLTANRTVDALLLESGATVNGPFTLIVGSGATPGLVVARGTGTNLIANTLVDFGIGTLWSWWTLAQLLRQAAPSMAAETFARNAQEPLRCLATTMLVLANSLAAKLLRMQALWWCKVIMRSVRQVELTRPGRRLASLRPSLLMVHVRLVTSNWI